MNNFIEQMKLKLLEPNSEFTREEVQQILTEYTVLETKHNRLKNSIIQSGQIALETLERINSKIQEL